MMKRSKCAVGVALVAGALLAGPADVLAQAESARVTAAKEAQQRGELVRLLDSAKGLNQALKRVSEERKIDNSRAVQENEQKLRQAEAALAEGRTVDARLLLEEAYLACKLAIADLAKAAPAGAQPAAAAQPAADDPAQRKAYASRAESTKALRDALERIAKEKNDAGGTAEVGVIDKLMRDADAQLAANNLKRGRALLDHAYLRAKVQIERLRGGETLVRTLHFDSKSDEYRYEQDRNETYRMLIPMLVPNGSEREARLKDVLARAQALRGDADAKAKGKAFDDALKLIDDSTAEYQKAIRNAGVLIPG